MPIRSDSILLHPVTMETLGIAITTSVLVETKQAMTACRVWPCVNLPLDSELGELVEHDALCVPPAVAGVGSTPLLSVGCVVGGMVKISPIAPGASLVAGQLELEPTSTE